MEETFRPERVERIVFPNDDDEELRYIPGGSYSNFGHI